MNNEKTCKNCGKQISEDFKLCPYCGEKVEEEILEIQCPSCGKTIKSDFKVYPYCGNNPNDKKENYNDYDTENRENYNSNTNQSDNPIICQFCGKPKKSEFQICHHCGNNHNNKKENHNNYNAENKVNYSTIEEELKHSVKHDYYEISKKSGVACVILLIFLFPLLAHRFYAGRIIIALFLLILNGVELFLLQNMGDESIFYSFMIILGIIFLILMIDFVEIIIGRFRDSKGNL